MANFDLLSGISIMEIGTTLSSFLFGISTLQAYTYSLRFSKDRLPLKVLAFSVWALELGHAISILHFFYSLSVLQYSQFDFMMKKAPISLAIAALLDGLLSFLVSGFFIHRVLRLTKNTPITVVCLLLSTLRLIGLITLSILGTHDTEVDFLQKRKWIVIASATVGAAVDVLISGTLILNLYKRKKEHFDTYPSQRSLKVLDQLIVDTLKTGLITSVLSLALAICLLTMTDSLAWVAVFVCQARAFTNSFFGTLNARANLRSPGDLPKHTVLQFAAPKTDASNSHTTTHLTFLVTAPSANHARRSRAHTIHSTNTSVASDPRHRESCA